MHAQIHRGARHGALCRKYVRCPRHGAALLAFIDGFSITCQSYCATWRQTAGANTWLCGVLHRAWFTYFSIKCRPRIFPHTYDVRGAKPPLGAVGACTRQLGQGAHLLKHRTVQEEASCCRFGLGLGRVEKGGEGALCESSALFLLAGVPWVFMISGTEYPRFEGGGSWKETKPYMIAEQSRNLLAAPREPWGIASPRACMVSG